MQHYGMVRRARSMMLVGDLNLVNLRMGSIEYKVIMSAVEDAVALQIRDLEGVIIPEMGGL